MTAPGRRPMVWIWPPVAILFFVVASALGLGATFQVTTLGLIFAISLVPILFGTVFAAVYHSEVIAVRIGEPFGTLVLTVAVTIIEVALITSVMATGKGSPTLARDSVFAVIMLVCNGLVGLCIVVGGLRFHEQSFRVTGASSYLIVLMSLAVLTLVLPNYTVTAPGPAYSTAQLEFVSVVTILLYAAFLYIQTVRHRDHFIPELDEVSEADDHAVHVPTNAELGASGGLLLLALVGVVLLAKKFAALVEVGLQAVGAPVAVAGIVVALIILLPEGLAAIGAARQNQLQKSLNLALGSSLATIGLTIPAVAALNISMGHTLILGIDAKDTVLLVLTFAVSLLTFGTGRTNILSGFVHLVLTVTYAFLVLIP